MASKISQWTGLIGSILEHHDKALFVLLAPFISTQYFPSEDLVSSLIEMYGMIVLSLCVRPLAALYFGPLADQKGRKAALLISLMGMSLSTIAIGILPNYASWGWVSPLLLFIFRCGQNFFGAGELTGGAVYVLEHTQDKYKPLVSSLFESSIILGILIASLETTILAYFGILESYWYVLFIIAGSLGLLGTIARSYAKESPEFLQGLKIPHYQLKDFWKERKVLLAIAITTGFSYGTYILSITFVNAFLKVISSIEPFQMTSINTILIVVDFVTLPLFGLLALRLSPRLLMNFAAGAMAIFAIPLFAWMVHSESLVSIVVVRLIIVVLGVCFAAPYRAWIQELVPAARRCTLLNFGGTIGQLFVEGPMTMLSLLFLEIHQPLMPAILLALLGVASVLVIRRTT